MYNFWSATGSVKIKVSSKLVKQCLRRFDHEKHSAIEEEVGKLLVAGFIREVLHLFSKSGPCTQKGQ